MSDFEMLTVDYRAADAPARLTRSLRDTGFAVLTGHPIAAERIDAAYGAWAEFFAGGDKSAYMADPDTGAGYFPFRSENAKGANAKDLKEFFHVYASGPAPAALEPETRSLYADLVNLGEELLGWVETEMPAEAKAALQEPLAPMVQGSRHNLLRILHYPPLAAAGEAAEPGAVRAAAHEDINLLTLLVAGSAPGLEALDAAGRWHEVPCDPGMITINVGDMLQKATGGYFPSTTHRVVNPALEADGSRYSMPMFLHPRPEVRLDAAYTADEYLQERLREIGLKS